MPYIPPSRRIEALVIPSSVGELTYALTDECLDYLPPDPQFSDFSEVIAALEATKLEFYRRMVVPYEEGKRLQHGDVYPPDVTWD